MGSSMMLNGSDPTAFTADASSRLNHYFQVDKERQTFIHNILERVEADAKKINELELDLEDQKTSRANYQSKAINLENEVRRLAQQLDKDSFVVVLIDGDGAKFADEYLRDPVAGAERAAIKLKQAVRESLRDTGADLEDIPILVRVYANLMDLSKSLRLSRVIDYDDDMRLFAERFTNSRAEFDFVNVGKGKENADSKIRRMLNHYYRNIQCKKIFLAGCCHDNGYLHDLRDYTGAVDNRLVLLETTHAEPGFRSLGFPILRFDEVFRSEPLGNETKHILPTMPPRPRSPVQPSPGPGPIARPTQPAPPTQPTPKQTMVVSPIQEQRQSPAPTSTPVSVSTSSPILPSSTPEQQPNQPPRTSSVISSGNGGTSISYATAGGVNDLQNVTVKAPKPKKQPRVLFYNMDNYRIDSPTQHPPRTPAQSSYQAKFQAIKPSVFCNDFYLKGRCKWGLSCDKTHDAELTGPELAIHRYKARTSLCPAGPYCVDYDCYLSHHCPRAPCTRGDMCPFYDTEKWGDLHLTKDQLQPATRWTEGIDLPEHI
ncbi:uncharacterized protein GGS22DRAFT_154795 [Annulohypoxylon maeteangense]|uniref:uncharacterized protein n=1 Tax=Annulohypoxylon maeteangense TaxID=1927788 RepID=UPI00200747AA|nr:uncharacterized protein GGS22DRAFT_154795 [Annulohypoxylon maeteangense]KAI0888006.1 hypothetical protein GGS22DRAFT_154795 [Annulohypoxylon maeteangense]